MEIETLTAIKIFIPAATAFFVGILITPLVAHYLYAYKLWKKKPGNEVGLGGGGTPIFNKLHKERDSGTPRMGGVVIWGSIIITTFIYWFLSMIIGNDIFTKLNFLSNNQTWLPLATLVAASIVGLFDDLLQVYGKGSYVAGGLSLKRRIFLILLIGLAGAIWFYFKLEYSAIIIPIIGEFELGILFIPFFMLVMLSLFSGGVIDGIDGLSGGVMASIFAAYAGIAFFQNQIDIAAFSAVITGGILAFLWFNIPPARFYMGETGMIGLTAALSVIAFLTNAVVPLLVIALPLYLVSLSVIIQVLSKKFRNGKKVFLVAPIHHHFEAMGWPSYKVTMRFWIFAIVFSILGMVLALI